MPTITQNVVADIDGATGAVTESAELVFTGRGQQVLACPTYNGGKDWESVYGSRRSTRPKCTSSSWTGRTAMTWWALTYSGSIDIPLTCSNSYLCRGDSAWLSASNGTVPADVQIRVRTYFYHVGSGR